MDTKDDNCCVSDELAVKISEIALELDKKMDCALDIEFGVTAEGDVMILQARPITTCFTWTDWELRHEFDTAVPSDTEIYTRGNVGEVFNGALTPLTMSTVVKSLDLAICHLNQRKVSQNCYVTHTSASLAVTQHQVDKVYF